MRTEMHDATPHSIRMVSARKVAFTFDLTVSENANLRDKSVVTRSMAGFMLAYENLESYRAEYVGDYLVLTCTGTIVVPSEPI